MLRNNRVGNFVPLNILPTLRGHSGNPRGVNFDTPDSNPTNPPGNNPGGNPPGEREPEVKMTQADFDAIIQKRVSAAARKKDEELTGVNSKLTEALAEIEKLKNAKPTNPPKDDKGNPDPEKYIPKSEWDTQRTKIEKEANDRIDALSKQVMNLLGEKKRGAVISAASRANAVDPEIVAQLVESFVDFDDENAIFFKDAKGEARYGSKGDYLTADEFISEFLDGKPYLRKSGATPGGGSDSKAKGGKVPSNASPIERISAGLKNR